MDMFEREIDELRPHVEDDLYMGLSEIEQASNPRICPSCEKPMRWQSKSNTKGQWICGKCTYARNKAKGHMKRPSDPSVGEHPQETQPCPQCGREMKQYWYMNASLKAGGCWRFNCTHCHNQRSLAKNPNHGQGKGAVYVRRQKLAGEYAARLTGIICETCGREKKQYWMKSSRYKAGGTWSISCPGCNYRKKRDSDPDYHKKLYARRKEIHPDLYEKIAPWTREWTLKREYGLTTNEYDAMFAAQNGVCAICKQEEMKKHRNGKTLRLSVDHNHKTGAVRGLLCSRCNLTLGKLEEASGLLEAMQAYLAQYE